MNGVVALVLTLVRCYISDNSVIRTLPVIMAVHGLTVIVMCLMIIGNLADETCGQGEYIIIQINHIGSQLRVQWTYHVVKKTYQ